MERKREFLWVGVLIVSGALAWFGLRLRRAQGEAKARVRLEKVAIERLRFVAAAERTYHERHGRYAWIADLAAEHLLPAASLDANGRVASPGYRIDILLPYARGARDLVQVAPRERGRPSERLVRRHFAIAARPSGERLTGYRSFYVDESGRMLQSHGVGTTQEGHPGRLPLLHLGGGDALESVGPAWTPLSPTGVP